ncbi:unnamed protein product [Effrenium voratum]|uniref:RNase H type-1 domain-containing protein n=1 Tax=Effrenium voratum TaxID=2562239 RepID=A0AA36IR95_9DINO|nr:unnamed protein product [Effrenium voratum]
MVWNSWMGAPIAGELFTGVVAAEQQMEGGATRCTLVGLGLPILVDLPLVEGSRYTLYFFLAQENTPLRLMATATSDCILAQPLCFEHYSRVKELCAGIGGIGAGCVAAGAKVVAALDRNSFACTHLEQNLNCPVVLGDSTNDVDLLRLHRAGGTEPAAAAPLQSLWVYAHLRRSADVHHDEFTIIEPLQLLHDYKSHLLDTMHDFWQIPNSLVPHPVLLSEADDQPYHITCQASTSVEDLLQAEDFRRSWGHTLQLFDGGRPVPRHALLQAQGRSGPYELRSVPKRQASDQPQGMIFITLHMNPLPITLGIASGSFLFQALLEEGLDTCTPIYDAGGHPVDPSIRLWRCTTLWTSSTRGAGPVQSARAGLTGSFLQYIAAGILMNSDHARRFGLPFLHLLIEDQPSLPLAALQRQLDIGGFDIILLCQGHWILLSLRKVNSGICCIGYDGLITSTCTEEVGQFVTGLADSLHKQLLAIRWITVFQQCAPDLCGTILLAHLVWMSGIDHALRHCDLKQLHSHFVLLERHLQALHVLPFEEHQGTGPQPAPNEAHLLAALRELLITKGVPESRAEERALLGLKKLGHSELQSALQAAQPWACLKSIASRPHFSFKWIKADELNAKIRARASDQFHVQQSENKRRPRERKQPAATLHINPQQLSLIQSSFVDNDGKEVPQIAFQDIGQGKAGLAFGGLNELAPYLREGVTISTEALGVLTTVPIPNEMIGSLNVTNCRFPAHYQATSEPVLIQGSLVQLGAKTITRKHEDINDLDVVTTQTLRITIYKDEWTGSWNHFQERPIRGLVEVLPIFQLCRTDGCGATCPKFHSPVDQTLESLLLDIWSRSWMSTTGKFCQPKDAVAFSAMIRTPRCALSSIQSSSGSHGVYIEPRSPCGKLSDDSFGVVWIPGADLPNVKHRLSVMDKALCVCRLHNKYGLRFNHTDLQAAHSTLRPFDTFVNSRIQTVYRLFPLPFGTQRGALQHCITKWGWNAKVLQAAGGGPEGSAWEVGAQDPPPSSIMQGTFGDVAITLIKTVSKQATPAPVLASSSTRRHMQTGAPSTATTTAPSAAVDPWLAKDPWGGSTAASSGPDRLHQFEARLKEDIATQVRAQLQDTHMEVEDAEPTGLDNRMNQLEVSIQELQQHHRRFEQYFSEVQSTTSNQSAKIEHIHNQLEQQGREVEFLRTDLRHQVATLQLSWRSAAGRLDTPRASSSTPRGEAPYITTLGYISLHFSSLHGSDTPTTTSFGSSVPRSGLARLFYVSTALRDRGCGSGHPGCHGYANGLPFSHASILLDGDTNWQLSVSAKFPPIGEASNPGPPFAITVANPTGLRSKENVAFQLPRGIVCLAETHLAPPGMSACCGALRRAATADHRRLWILPGAPVPLRARSLTTGVWAGVLQFSDIPAHRLQLHLPAAEYTLGRTQTSVFNLGSTQILGTVVYGWSPGPTWPQAKTATRNLLQQLSVEIIYGRTGPRFVAGDFNGEDFPEFEEWISLGWTEVQSLHAQLHHEGPFPTCKGSTRPDQIFISPELRQYFIKADVLDVFSDHSAVTGWFDIPMDLPPQHFWPMPAKIPWPSVDVPAWQQSPHAPPAHNQFTGTGTSYYHEFGRCYEDSFDGFTIAPLRPGLLPAHRGRCQHLHPQDRPFQPPLLKPSRHGEALPASDFLGRINHRWFTQLRRLQSLLHNLRRGSNDPTAIEYRLLTWEAIKKAKGFQNGFCSWWATRPIPTAAACCVFPVTLPTVTTMEAIYTDFHANYKALESWNVRQRCAILRARRAEHLKEAFHDITHREKAPLTHLTISEETNIIYVDPTTWTVTTDKDILEDGSSTWLLEDTKADFKRFMAKQPHLLELWFSFVQHYDGTLFSGPFSKLLITWAFRSTCSKNPGRPSGFGFVMPGDNASLAKSDIARINSLREGAFLTGEHQGRFDMIKDLQLCTANTLGPWSAGTITPARSLSTFYPLLYPRNDHFDISYTISRPALACAAWAVVSFSHEATLAASPLAGLQQDIDRAELHAVLCAVSWLVRHRCHGTVWSDSAYATCGLAALLSDRAADTPATNSDLWENLRFQLDAAPDGLLQVQHVPGHMQVNSDSPCLDEWLATWNGHADTAAKQAHGLRPPAFWNLWCEYKAAFEDSCIAVDRFRCLHLDVAAALQDNTYVEVEAPAEEALRAPLRPCTVGGDWAEELPINWQNMWSISEHATRFGRTFAINLVSWLQQQHSRDPISVQLSWLELAMAVFLFCGAHPSPTATHTGEQWLDAQMAPPTAGQITVAGRVRYIRGLVKALASFFACDCIFVGGLDRSFLRVHPPLQGLVLTMSRDSLTAIDEAFGRFTCKRPIRKGNDLCRPF